MKQKYQLGLHTQEERDRALQFAKRVHQEAKKQILEHDDRDALLFAEGYIAAIEELAKTEGQRSLADEAIMLLWDLELAYYQIPYPSKQP